MRIKEIYIKDFGPYHEWSFTPASEGVQVIYGPNESGKTSLLEALRFLLFGKKSKTYGYGSGYLVVERDGVSYHIGRDGKKLNFYSLGKGPISEEPAALWWHGLDKKTYDRIFAITVDELQGADVLAEVEVRARFFGGEGGERLSTAVKDIEKASSDLLVASANGKRKINVLMERLKQLREKMAELGKNEDTYTGYQKKLYGIAATEKELQERLKEWQDYGKDVDLVLRAWDVYKRAEHAKDQMNTYAVTDLLEKDAFYELDEKITQCRNNMKLWSGKEAGLVPENFAPDSLIGVYSQEIENIFQELGKWTQLQKECEQGRSYLKRVKEQLDLSRTLHNAWRADAEMPEKVDWATGEKLARELRSAQDNYLNWQKRKPIEPADIANSTVKDEENSLKELETGMAQLKQAFTEFENSAAKEKELNETNASPLYRYGAIALLVIGIGLMVGMPDMGLWLGILCFILAAAAFWYGWQQSRKLTGLREAALHQRERWEELFKAMARDLDMKEPQTVADIRDLEDGVAAKRAAFSNQNLVLAKIHSYEQVYNQWLAEGKELEAAGNKAMEAWQRWLPEGASRVLTDNQFFALKQEYDTYMEDFNQYKEYEKRLEEHEASLHEIESRCAALWEKLELDIPVTPIELRRVYNLLKSHRQNQVRWEQKESQRRNYHEEYEQWSRQEKALLLEQQELLQKNGIATAGEYRQRLLLQDQYVQWQTVYEQSREQLALFAPKKDSHEALYRRLKSGNKEKWQTEVERSRSEMAALQKHLNSLYEKRGQIQEAMRTLSQDKAMSLALQEEQQLEGELQEALTAWATQVLVSHFMELAQMDYEKERQPEAMANASSYLSLMTDGKYTLQLGSTNSSVEAVLKTGEVVPTERWSSGMGDQVYLALRLSLAKVFAQRVESLPIILDDILLRFDEGRQNAALKLLAHIGQTEQVFIFTCQQGTAERSAELDGVSVYDLSTREAM